jgi:hypothetical protein
VTSLDEQRRRTRAALNKVARWRTIYAGWQLGTRPDTDPETRAVRDHRDLSTLLRIDATALASLLIDKGVFTEQEWLAMQERAAMQLDEDLERKFPGARTTDIGVQFYDMDRAMEWWSKFPQ